jgi:CRP-like cAMP-binding protein
VRHGWAVEGLLRVSAPTYQVRGLWAFISSSDFSLVRVSNVHVLASTLKLYLREQRQFVVHRALFPQINACMRSQSVDEQRSGLKYVVSLMDPVRRLILFEICRACAKILLHSASNKMDRDNISICLSPSVIEADSDDPMEIASTAPLGRAAFSLLLADSSFFDSAQVTRDRENVPDAEVVPRTAFHWERLTEHEWNVMFGSATATWYKPGEHICREGVAGTCVMRVLSGSCLSSRHGRGGEEMGALDVAGVELSLGLQQYSSSVVASSATLVYHLPVASLLNAFAVDPMLGFKWYCSAAVALALLRMRERASPLDTPSIWSPKASPQSDSSDEGPLSVSSDHSSTASFAIKRYAARMVEEGSKIAHSGVLALTATHLSFERSSSKSKSSRAVFVSLALISRVSAAEDGRLTVHYGDETFVCELEDAAFARELRDGVTRVLALRHEAKLASNSLQVCPTQRE